MGSDPSLVGGANQLFRAAHAAPHCPVTDRGGFSLVNDMVAIEGGAWAVGDQGILLLEQGNWRLYQASGRWLDAIDARESAAWAVGSSGSVLRLQDGIWQDVWTVPGASFADVSIAGPGDVGVVGSIESDGGAESQILHYSAGAWEVVAHLAGLEATAVHMLSPTQGWVAIHDVSGSRLLRWDESGFVGSDHPPIAFEILSIHSAGPKNIWAGGGQTSFEGLHTGGAVSTLLHYNGFEWSVVEENFKFKIREVHTVSHDDAWAAGSAGNIIRYDGTKWDYQFASGMSTWGFGAIGYFDEDNVWFGGATQMVHLDLGEFSFWGGDRYNAGGSHTSITAAPDGSVWAAGWDGPVLRRDDAGWASIDGIPSSSWVDRVFAAPDGGIWFAYLPPEPKGFIAEPQRDGWVRVELPTSYPVVDMEFGADGQVWALASRSREFAGVSPGSDVLLREEGGWRVVQEVRDGGILRAMELTSPNTAWFAGDFVATLRDSARETIPIPGEPPPRLLMDVSFESPERGWFVGAGSLLSYNAGSWSIDELSRDPDAGGLFAVESVGEGSVVTVGSLGAFFVSDTEVTSIDIKSSGPLPPHLVDVAITSREGRSEAWVSGAYELVARIELSCAASAPKPSNTKLFLPITLSNM